MLVGFDQIPGLASQRLMQEGYDIGAGGDWKTACLYRTLWVIQQGLPTGCSFLEDYTLNFARDRSSCLQNLFAVMQNYKLKFPTLSINNELH